MTDARRITSRLDADGTLTVAVEPYTPPPPGAGEVLVEMLAAPINPSDLGLMFGPADLANAAYAPGRIVARMPAAATRAMAARHGQALPVGIEGAGRAIAAGAGAEALIGRLVACMFGGGAYATHAVATVSNCLPLPDGVSAEQGAAAFVNPLTALGFVETMRTDGATALVHTAAASNLGRMLVRICAADGIGLVNIVRSAAQANLLRGIGAQHVVDSSAPGFDAALAAAIRATGATLAFDAIGGGDMAGRILVAMERVAGTGMRYSRYGSDTAKAVYVYGALDTSPTVLDRRFGFTWQVAGWLLMPFMASVGEAGMARLQARVAAGLTTTFASSYAARVGLEQSLTRDAALAYNARATGEKYLIVPSG